MRRWSSAVRLGRFPLEIVACDVLDPTQIERAVSGVDVVIHCVSGSSEAIVDGTRNLLSAATRNDVKRFVHVSSAEVYGNADGVVDERTPTGSRGNEYADAKLAAEDECRAHSARGLALTVVRPSIVYGPFGETWSVRIAENLRSGNWRWFAEGADGRCNLIYVTDLVEAVLTAARSDRAIGEAYNLVGPDEVSWNEYFSRFNRSLGLPELRVSNPAGTRIRSAAIHPVRNLARAVASKFDRPLRELARRVRPAKQAMLAVERVLKATPQAGDLELYRRNAVYSAEKAKRELGFRPRVDLDTGLELTVGWLRHVGLVD